MEDGHSHRMRQATLSLTMSLSLLSPAALRDPCYSRPPTASVLGSPSSPSHICALYSSLHMCRWDCFAWSSEICRRTNETNLLYLPTFTILPIFFCFCFEEAHWMTADVFICMCMPANYCKSVSQSKAPGSSKNRMCDSHLCLSKDRCQCVEKRRGQKNYTH